MINFTQEQQLLPRKKSDGMRILMMRPPRLLSQRKNQAGLLLQHHQLHFTQQLKPQTQQPFSSQKNQESLTTKNLRLIVMEAMMLLVQLQEPQVTHLAVLKNPGREMIVRKRIGNE